MKRLSLSILLIVIATTAFAMGGWGTYTISGIMLEKKTKQPLKNTVIIIKAKARYAYVNDTISTDAEGNFSYEMHWETACPSGKTKSATHRLTKMLNPKKISFHHNSSVTIIKNEWRERLTKQRATSEIYFVRLYL